MILVLFLCLRLYAVSNAWVSSTAGNTVASRQHGCCTVVLAAHTNKDDGETSQHWNRRDLFAAAAVALTTLTIVDPANALVKGVAPPPPKSAANISRPKCTNVEECQAMAAAREQQEREAAEANTVPSLTTASGKTRYRDTKVGSSSDSDAVVQVGDDVAVYYKVLKLGKRSYDGLSGEGTVVFSRGYGYEDDETQPRQASFVTTVGAVGAPQPDAVTNFLAAARAAGVTGADPAMLEDGHSGGSQDAAAHREHGWRSGSGSAGP